MEDEKSKYPVEVIAPDDLISRCCFSINGVRPLDLATDFTFSDPNHVFPNTLSAVWRKYAVERHDVDQRGEHIAREKNQRNKRVKKIVSYTGFRTALADDIRSIRTERDFGLAVDHAPSNTFRAHAHISIVSIGNPAATFTVNDKRDVVSELISRMPLDEPAAII